MVGPHNGRAAQWWDHSMAGPLNGRAAQRWDHSMAGPLDGKTRLTLELGTPRSLGRGSPHCHGRCAGQACTVSGMRGPRVPEAQRVLSKGHHLLGTQSSTNCGTGCLVRPKVGRGNRRAPPICGSAVRTQMWSRRADWFLPASLTPKL